MQTSSVNRIWHAATCAWLAMCVPAIQADLDIHRAGYGPIAVTLPNTEADGNLHMIERSQDLVSWYPVARDYTGEGWQNIFPTVLPLTGEQGNQSLQDSGLTPMHFYRVSTHAMRNGRSESENIARFLQQATFGPSLADILEFPRQEVTTLIAPPPTSPFETWIDDQMTLPLTSHRAHFRARSNPEFIDNSSTSPYEIAHNPAYGHQYNYYVGRLTNKPDQQDAVNAGRSGNDVIFPNPDTKRIVWYNCVLGSSDALRQKIAWALSQLFVVGEEGSSQIQISERWLAYYDIFVRHAFGNYRDILGEVTWSPHMGFYLTYINNRAATATTFPDENYAREVMQLFTIGLWELNQDGTPRYNPLGELLPTYTIDDVAEFAKIFTGMRGMPNRDNIEIIGGNYIDPMRIQTSWHDFSEKTLLDGSTLGPYPSTAQGAADEINAFLDYLFNHDNMPPFFSRFMIQRLTLSNPSPQYIHDVAEAFRTGLYNGLGRGRRGDMTAVVKAVLLHPEARTATLAGDVTHGRLREPLERLLHVARAFNITSLQTYGFLPFDDLMKQIGQAPYLYPSVFNFYLPDYQPSGVLQDYGMYAPEFQILNDITALSIPNTINVLTYKGIRDEIGSRSYAQATLDFSYEQTIADDSESLMDHLDLVLTAGRLDTANRETLLTLLNSMPFSTETEKRARVQAAISLFGLVPEYHIID